VTPRSALSVVLLGVAATAAAPAQAGPASTGATGPTKKVLIYDNYYAPTKVTVNRGTNVAFIWPDDFVGDVHDVKLIKAPNGVKRWQSDPGAAGYVFKRKLTVSGEYRMLCTFHEEDGMLMTVVVRRNSS